MSTVADYYRDHDRSPSPKDTRDIGVTSATNASASGPTNDTQALQSEISHLENLVHEALQLANTAVDLHEARKVPAMLEEAEHRLHRASERAKHPLAPGDVPFSLAGGSVPYSDSSSSSSDDDELGNTRRSSRSSGAPLTAPSRAHDPVAVDWAYKNSQSIPVQPLTHSENNQVPTSSRDVQSRDLPTLANSSSSNGPSIPQRQSSLSAPLTLGYQGASTNAGPVQRTIPRAPTEGGLPAQNWGRDKFDEKDYISADELKGKHHITLREHQHFSLNHHHRQPIARNWSTRRKRFTAFVTCINTALIGIIAGIYVSLG